MIRAWEAATTMEVVCVAVVRVAEASVQEAATTRESIVALVKEEDRATLAEREAWERVPRMEAESVTVLASTHGDAEVFARRIALLEGELMEAH
jgi:hypothetical protein